MMNILPSLSKYAETIKAVFATLQGIDGDLGKEVVNRNPAQGSEFKQLKDPMNQTMHCLQFFSLCYVICMEKERYFSMAKLAAFRHPEINQKCYEILPFRAKFVSPHPYRISLKLFTTLKYFFVTTTQIFSVLNEEGTSNADDRGGTTFIIFRVYILKKDINHRGFCELLPSRQVLSDPTGLTW